MSRLSFIALFCLASLPAAASAQTAATPPAPTPPPAAAQPPAGPPPAEMAAVQQTGMAFGQCVQAGSQAVPATVTPEAGAATVLSGCATQRQQLDQALRALVAAVPEAQRPMVQQQIDAQLAGVEAQVAAGIRQARTPAAPAATPTPAPAQ
ncbi:MAG TPA: hypothetical protein VMG08_13515 [Allosphingosinicella sp.]|nr:hypothetical protein [Allosphingosinicella sp.]